MLCHEKRQVNEPMKEKFQLWSKVIGLFIISSNIVILIWLVGLLILGSTDYNEIKDSIQYGNLGYFEPLLKQYNNFDKQLFSSIAKVERDFLLKCIFISFFSLAFGAYLLRSNNFFVRFAFSRKEVPSQKNMEKVSAVESSEVQSFHAVQPRNDDSRWKPPNY